MPTITPITYQGQKVSDTNQPQSVQLKSGQIWLVPPGVFYIKLGAQSALQLYDYYSATWRLWDSGPSPSPVLLESDGTNYRVINWSGTIGGLNVTAAGSNYASSTTLSFAAPASGITATAAPIIGGKLSLAIPSGSTGGTGYTNPYLFIPPPQLLGGTPGLCIPATATLGISGGVINAETLGFAGAGYVTAPGNATQTITPAAFALNPGLYQNSTNMIIIDPAGTGATIQATVGGAGTITGAVMTNPGSGYDGTHIPAVTITDPTGAGSGATITALPQLALTSVTVGGTNTGYTASVIGITELALAGTIEQSFFGEPILPRPGRFTAAQSGGALGTPVIEDAGGPFQVVPLAKQVGNATADGSVNATFTSVIGGVTNTLIYWQIG